MGRFITEDPIKDGTNWYIYCRNNPLIYTDPTGLKNTQEGMNDAGYDNNGNYDNNKDQYAPSYDNYMNSIENDNKNNNDKKDNIFDPTNSGWYLEPATPEDNPRHDDKDVGLETRVRPDGTLYGYDPEQDNDGPGESKNLQDSTAPAEASPFPQNWKNENDKMSENKKNEYKLGITNFSKVVPSLKSVGIEGTGFIDITKYRGYVYIYEKKDGSSNASVNVLVDSVDPTSSDNEYRATVIISFKDKRLRSYPLKKIEDYVVSSNTTYIGIAEFRLPPSNFNVTLEVQSRKNLLEGFTYSAPINIALPIKRED